jgi:hypothetical protein
MLTSEGTVAILAVLVCALAPAQQAGRKSPVKPGTTTASPTKAPVQPGNTAGRPVRTGFFHMESPTGFFSDAKLMFTDLTDCRVYEFVEPPFADFSLSTKGFYVVSGRIVGKQLRGTAVVPVDDAAGDRLRAGAERCAHAAEAEARKRADATGRTASAGPEGRNPGLVDKIAAQLANAKDLTNAGDLVTALRTCDDILREAPGNQDASQLRLQVKEAVDKRVATHLGNAEDLYRQGKLTEAGRECESAFQLDPGNTRVLALRTRISRAIEILYGQ